MATKKDLSAALSQRKNIPPLQRGKGIQLSSDEAVAQGRKDIDSQESNNADQQISEVAMKRQGEEAKLQVSEVATAQPSGIAASQLRKNAEIIESSQAVKQSSENLELLECNKVKMQSSEIAKEQKSKPAITQPSETAKAQSSNNAIEQESEFSEQQLKEIAKMLQKVIAKGQSQETAKQRKEDSADLLIQALADVQISIQEVEQFRKIAESQRRKVNQGVTIPEALFTIYKACGTNLTLKGKKVTMGDLMAKALIKYLVEDIIPKLGQD